jgi:hypothetical protein
MMLMLFLVFMGVIMVMVMGRLTMVEWESVEQRFAVSVKEELICSIAGIRESLVKDDSQDC